MTDSSSNASQPTTLKTSSEATETTRLLTDTHAYHYGPALEEQPVDSGGSTSRSEQSPAGHLDADTASTSIGDSEQDSPSQAATASSQSWDPDGTRLAYGTFVLLTAGGMTLFGVTGWVDPGKRA